MHRTWNLDWPKPRCSNSSFWKITALTPSIKIWIDGFTVLDLRWLLSSVNNLIFRSFDWNFDTLRLRKCSVIILFFVIFQTQISPKLSLYFLWQGLSPDILSTLGFFVKVNWCMFDQSFFVPRWRRISQCDCASYCIFFVIQLVTILILMYHKEPVISATDHNSTCFTWLSNKKKLKCEFYELFEMVFKRAYTRLKYVLIRSHSLFKQLESYIRLKLFE